MAEQSRNPFEKGQLMREAIDWWVLMHGDDANGHREDFEQWLGRGAMHRVAYNRVAHLYGAGKNVDWEALPATRPVRGAARRSMLVVVSLLVLVGFLGWRLIWTPFATSESVTSTASSRKGREPPAQLITRLGEIRRVGLPDGSKLILDTDTLVTVDFRNDQRELRLEHGRARFEVAHERRPFVVDAENGSVTAHGTIFDVAIDDHHSVHVALLRGSIDVKTVSPVERPRGFATRLSPGQSVAYSEGAAPGTVMPRAQSDWPSGMQSFSDASLADVLDAANHYSITKIRAYDKSVGSLRVSGTFRVDDPVTLSGSLAELFKLRADQDGSDILLERDPK